MSRIETVTLKDLPLVGNEEFCTPEETRRLQNAETLVELRVIGEVVLRRMPGPVTLVCGPMSSGGGRLQDNYARIGNAITILRKTHSRIVFSQLPFQHGIRNFTRSPRYRGPEQIIDDLYLHLFEKRLIHTLAFLTRWDRSFGSTLEHQHGTRIGLTIEYLPPDL